VILYGIIILFFVVLFSVTNAVFAAPVFGFAPWLGVAGIAAETALVIAVDGIFAFIIRRLPERWFSYKKRFFNVSKKEKVFYEKIGVRKWKDRIPELGRFTNFSKSKVERPNDNEYLERYMLEACYGEIIHIFTIFTGYLIIFAFPLRYAFLFGVPVATVNAILNVLPTFVLRYNFYKMKILHARNELIKSRSETGKPIDIAG